MKNAARCALLALGLTSQLFLHAQADRRTTPAKRDGARVIFYEDAGFRGHSFSVRAGAGVADLKKKIADSRGKRRKFDDRISSLRVVGSAAAVLYEDAGFKGRSVTVYSSIPDLRQFGLGRKLLVMKKSWNDRASSLKVIHHAGPAIPADVNRKGGEDSNPWVRNVEEKFRRIPRRVDRREYMGAFNPADSNSIPWPRYTDSKENEYRQKLAGPIKVKVRGGQNHFQGINRLPHHLGLSRYLVVSGGDVHAGHSHLFVIEMGTQGSRRRMRGNLDGKGMPARRDRIVKRVVLDRTLWHAGGMQVLGRYLAIGIESFDLNRSKVVFYDLADPRSPRKLDVEIVRPRRKCGAVAFTNLPDGRFLAIAWSDSDAIKPKKQMDVYCSRTKDFRQGFRHVGSLWPSTIVGGFRDYQTINFVTDWSGAHYLVGTYNTSKVAPMVNGRDRADLYRVEFPDGFDRLPRIFKVASKHMICKNDQCNFGAAGSAWVPDPDHLFLYGAFHWLRRKGKVLPFYQFGY